MEKNFQGGVRYKATGGSCKRRRRKTVWRLCSVWSGTRKNTRQKKTEGTPQLTNKMLDSLGGYLDNIAAASNQTTANGGPLEEFSASLAI